MLRKFICSALIAALLLGAGFAMMPNFTFGLAVSTFVGQNLGARELKRVDDGFATALKMGLAVSIALVAAILLFGQNLINMFTSTEQIILLGARGLRILAPGYLAIMFSQCYSGALRGAGDTMPGMWISLLTTVVVRVPLAYLIAAITRSEAWTAGHPDALFLSLTISWILGAVLNYWVYKKRDWRSRSLVDELREA